jgi:hypothetical protein
MDKTALREHEKNLQMDIKEFEKMQKGQNTQEIKVDYANPAKAREDMDAKIKEYYDKTAHELAIVLKCYTDAGFTRAEAFEICKLLVPGS